MLAGRAAAEAVKSKDATKLKEYESELEGKVCRRIQAAIVRAKHVCKVERKATRSTR